MHKMYHSQWREAASKRLDENIPLSLTQFGAEGVSLMDASPVPPPPTPAPSTWMLHYYFISHPPPDYITLYLLQVNLQPC